MLRFWTSVSKVAERQHVALRFMRTAHTVAGIDSDTFGDYVGPGESKAKQASKRERRDQFGKQSRTSGRRAEGRDEPAADSGDVFGTMASNRAERRQTIVDYENRTEYVFQEEPQSEATDAAETGEEKDLQEEPEVRNFVVTKHSPRYFKLLQRKYASEGKIAEMVAVIEKRMLEDRVRPDKQNFMEALTFLGRYGQPRKAFELYKKMGRMGIRSTADQRSSLFNACANCAPVEKEWALNQTKLLLNDSRGRYGALEPTEYHVAIKAYARHGELAAAFRVADLMVLDRVKPDVITFTHLLNACIADRSSGFKLALDVWRAMRAFGISADQKFYNSLLRACRDCGLGPAADGVVEQLASEQRRIIGPTSGGSHASVSPVVDDGDSDTPFSARVPTLQELDEKLDQLDAESGASGDDSKTIELVKKQATTLSVPQTNFRLALLRGASGVLHLMDADGAKPNVKTFALLLDLLPLRNVEEEKQLLESMKQRRVNPDVDFVNSLIARHRRRGQFQAALELLNQCKTYDLQLNERTFTSLAIGCYKRTMAVSLLRDMEALGLKPNVYVLTTLLHLALKRNRKYDFFYAMSVMSWYRKSRVAVKKDQLRHLEQCRREAEEIEEKRRVQNLKRNGAEGAGDDLPPVWGLKEFLSYYGTWLKTVQLEDQSIDPKLKILDKEVTADDVREDWEKPWVAQAEQERQMELLEKAKLIPVE